MTGILEPFVGYTSYLALLLRLFLGVSLVIHGYPKVKGGWKQSGQWMKGMGIPSFTAVAATLIEFFGGILLVVGLIVPVASAFAAVQFASIIAMKKSKMHAA
jgi:putative oxidoreductase